MRETNRAFCSTSCASKAAIKLKDGSIILMDLAPFKSILDEYPDITSVNATTRFIRVMDVLIEGFSPESGLRIEDIQCSYAWLKILRDTTASLKIKRISGKRFEELSRLDITKQDLYGSD